MNDCASVLIRRFVPLFLAIIILWINSSAIDITIDGAAQRQTIDGFGGSIMMWMPENKNVAWARFCAQELGVSLIRCELHPQIIGKFDNQRTFVDDITTNMGYMNASASEIDISFTAAKNFFASKLDSLKIMVSVWTQPHWMKLGAEDCRPDAYSRYTMGGTLPYTDSAREQNARYLTAAIKKVETAYGINIYGISPQNELDWWHACETYTESSKKYYSGDPEGPGYCTWIPETKRLRRELDAKGLGRVKIIGPEHATFGPEIWGAWQQMKYVRDIYNDTAMLKILDIWAVHSYGVPNAPNTLGRTNWSWLWDGHTESNPELVWKGYKNYNKPSWQTECKAGDGTWNNGAMVLANRMQDALIAGNVSAFLPWTLGAPSPDEYNVTDTDAPYTLPKTFAFKHFSRYIRPGAVRLDATPDNPAGLTVSAYHHKAQASLAVVLVNNGTAQTANISLPSTVTGITSFDVFTSTSSAFWQKSSAAVSSSRISVSVPANSIVTLYGVGGTVASQPRPLDANPNSTGSAIENCSRVFINKAHHGSVGPASRLYSIRGEYLGTFEQVDVGKKTNKVSSGMYIIHHRTPVDAKRTPARANSDTTD